MPKENLLRLSFALAIVAAALAFGAATVEYSRGGELNVGLMAAAVFLLAFGYAARRGVTK